MRTTYNPNERVATNFLMREFVAWPIIAANPVRLQENVDAFESNIEIQRNIHRIGITLQNIRNAVNTQFPQYRGRLGIRITSGFRNRNWEFSRGRNATSQHTTGHAVDFIVTNAGADTNIVMDWVFNHLRDFNGGLARKVTRGNYEFIHVDLHTRRRWNY